MTSVPINLLCPTDVSFQRVPRVFLDMMGIREWIESGGSVGGVSVLMLESEREGCHCWGLVPSGLLPEVENCVTVCYAANDTDHEWFCEAIESAREFSEERMAKCPPGAPEDFAEMVQSYNELQSPRAALTCPEGPWYAIVNGPKFFEVDEGILPVCGHLNAAIAAELLDEEE
jgi:hypothetical protein